MEEEILLDNNDINNFLQKYNENDRKIVLEKLEKIGLLFLNKNNNQKKDFYTLDDLDNIIHDLENNIIFNNEDNEKSNINELKSLKNSNNNFDNNEIYTKKRNKSFIEEIQNKPNSYLEKSNLINSYKSNYNNINSKYNSNYNPIYSNLDNKNNNDLRNSKYIYNTICNNNNNRYKNYKIKNYLFSKNFEKNNSFPCLNFNYSTSSPNIKNNKETDPCCNPSYSFINSYSYIRKKNYC